MAVRITSADSIRRAILADALLREIFEKVEVNTSGLAPIALGPSVGILGIPSIEGFEAEWKLNIIGLTQAEGNQVAQALERIFPGSSFGFSGENLSVRIFSLVTKEVLESIEQQQKIKEDEERTKKLESAIDYASRLQSGADGQRGERGERGEQGLRGERGLPGRDGRDGLDIDVTETELGDLKDVYVPEPKIGHVLTWDGANWVALFIPQKTRYGGAGIEEAPEDGNYYVRQNGEWVLLSEAMNSLGVSGGDFDP